MSTTTVLRTLVDVTPSELAMKMIFSAHQPTAEAIRR